MNKSQLVVDMVKSGNFETQTEAAHALKAVMTSINKGLKKDQEVRLVGLGTFRVTKLAARNGRNPATGEPIKIKARKVVRFRASSTLKV